MPSMLPRLVFCMWKTMFLWRVSLLCTSILQPLFPLQLSDICRTVLHTMGRACPCEKPPPPVFHIECRLSVYLWCAEKWLWHPAPVAAEHVLSAAAECGPEAAHPNPETAGPQQQRGWERGLWCRTWQKTGSCGGSDGGVKGPTTKNVSWGTGKYCWGRGREGGGGGGGGDLQLTPDGKEQPTYTGIFQETHCDEWSLSPFHFFPPQDVLWM